MGNQTENIHKFKIFARTTPTGENGEYQFVHEGEVRKTSSMPQFDFYIPVLLTKTETLYEYVEVFRDTSIYDIERQEINPWYVEFGFFDSIKYNKPTVGSGLTQSVVDLIKELKPELANYTTNEVMIWFDRLGYNEFPWNKGEQNEVTRDYLSKFKLNNEEIVSKAFYRNININT
jgi:hypothetical protein